ncbi:MAG: GGDEF domain-containing phosphodiesterase [Lachnospiraceae bacterium]|nr:GGDEF domain-containing phosphodiesterase [Lachnospiraceae bacterium]
MLDFLKKLLGLGRNTKFVRNYLSDTNLRTAIYNAFIVIAMETWMIIRFIVQTAIPKKLTFAQSFPSVKNYIILLVTGIVMFIFALVYHFGSKKRRTLGTLLIIAFAVICVYFGMITSLSDLTSGRELTCYITMMMFTATLLIWKPYISLFILICSFYIFGYLGNLAVAEATVGKYESLVSAGVDSSVIITALGKKADIIYQESVNALADKRAYFFRWLSEPCMQKGDIINLLFFYITLAMLSTSIYMQRLTEAKKDEGLEQTYKELHKKSITNAVTGIYNMTHFSEEAQKLLTAEGTDPQKKAFLFINIVNFSNYNEKYGFEKGNELLKTCAGLVRGCFYDDLYAKSSDDHFVVLTDEDKAESRLEALKTKVESIEKTVKLGIKAGGYIPKDATIDPRGALDNARYACNSIRKRKALYFQLYDERMEEELKRKKYIINNLEEAIANGYIKPYYQPVVWAKDYRLCGVEALARWIDPNLGFLSPAAFIPVLEEYKEIHKLDSAIMKAVCRDIREHLDKGFPVVPVSINFSRLDFELTDIVGEFEGYVREYNVPKEYLHIEITESALTEQAGILRDNINIVKEHGYPVWLDDFGSAYSSLNSLKEYSFDVMKIDMAFLRNFDTNPKAKPIIENVIRLAKDVNMETLTEGVETEAQAVFLKEAGCGRLQGFYFGKPMPVEELDESIRSGKYTVSIKEDSK